MFFREFICAIFAKDLLTHCHSISGHLKQNAYKSPDPFRSRQLNKNFQAWNRTLNCIEL